MLDGMMGWYQGFYFEDARNEPYQGFYREEHWWAYWELQGAWYEPPSSLMEDPTVEMNLFLAGYTTTLNPIVDYARCGE